MINYDWDKIINFIKLIEPLILVLIPLVFSICLKLKTKLILEKGNTIKLLNTKAKQELLDWRHTESINVVNKLKNVCNYHTDIGKVHSSYIQLENGTIATSKICNMFFSCISEDNRYSNIRKSIDIIQRVPFTRMSNWFNKVYNSEYSIVYLTKKEDIDDIFYDEIGIKCLMSSLVKDSNGLVIGVCNFIFDVPQDNEMLEKYQAQMIKFVSGVQTVFLNFNLELQRKIKELKLEEDEIQ